MLNLSQKFNKVSLILLFLGIGIGLLLTVQWKTPITRVSNPIVPYISLKDTRDSLINEQDDLKNQISTLQKEISQKETDLKKYTSSKKTIEEIEDYKESVGLTEKKGQGVVIKMNDAKGDEVTIDSITHAADLRDLVNFLYSIGAEAISINEERIVFATSIDCIINTILINSTKTTPPFEIKTIGQAKNLEKQLKNSNNLKDIKKRVKTQGLIFEISKSNDITIPAYDGSFVIEYAHIMD